MNLTKFFKRRGIIYLVLISLGIIFQESNASELMTEGEVIESKFTVNRKLSDFFEAFPDSCNKERVLLLACGLNGRSLRNKNEPYYSLDMIERFDPCVVADMNNLNMWRSIFPDECFDRVIWECPQMDAVRNVTSFNEAYRVLKAGGKAELIFVLEDEGVQQAVLSSAFNRYYSQSDLISALSIAKESGKKNPNLVLTKGGGPVEISTWINVRFEKYGMW